MMSSLGEAGHIGLLAHLAPRKVLLLGDLILDMYTYGQVARVSPEAPVQILQVFEESYLPGGAGNVALNLTGLGCEVYLCSRVGDDEVGLQLKGLLDDKGGGLINIEGIYKQQHFRTPLKNRLIASGQQLLRLDKEQPAPMDEQVRSKILQKALQTLSVVDILAISDYGKGAIDRAILEPIFERANKLGIPIIVDPKSKDFRLYKGATLIKPNFKEAQEASGLESKDIDLIAEAIFEKACDFRYLMVTRSQEGITVFERGAPRRDFLAKPIGVVDVTGAGDCVLAAVVHGLACGLGIDECSFLANIAGSLAVQKVGCVQLSLKDLAWRMLRTDTHNKVFDEAHLFALQEACRGEQVHIMQVHKEDVEKLDFLLAIRRYHRRHPNSLILIQLSASELDHETLDFLVEQDGIDLVVLLEHDRWINSQIQAYRIVNWRAGRLQSAQDYSS